MSENIKPLHLKVGDKIGDNVSSLSNYSDFNKNDKYGDVVKLPVDKLYGHKTTNPIGLFRKGAKII